MSEEPFKSRQRIIWRNKKHGEFIAMKLEKRYKTWGTYQYSSYLAKVQLEGNRNMSVVSIYDLKPEPVRKEIGQ